MAASDKINALRNRFAAQLEKPLSVTSDCGSCLTSDSGRFFLTKPGYYSYYLYGARITVLVSSLVRKIDTPDRIGDDENDDDKSNSQA